MNNNNVVSSNPPTGHHNSPITNGGNASDVSSQHQQHPVFSHNLSVSDPQASQYSLAHNQHRYAQRDGPATLTLPPGTRIQPAIIPDSTQVQNVQQQELAAATMYVSGMYPQATNTPQAGYAMHSSGYANPQLATSGGYYYQPASQFYNTASGYAVAPQALIMQQTHQAATYQILSQPQQVIPTSTHATQQLISTTGNVGQHQAVNVSIGMPVTAVSMPQNNVNISSGGTLTSTNSNTATQLQPMRQRKPLKIVNPDSGEYLNFGPDTKNATSVGPSAASDEETKSTVVKTDFYRKVAEAANQAGALQQNKHSPSSSFVMGNNGVMNLALLEQQRQHQTTGSIPIIQKGAPVTTTGFTETNQTQKQYLLHTIATPFSATNFSQPIPIEQPTMPIIHQHSPHNLPSIVEMNIPNPSPKKEDGQPKFIRTSPALLIEEQKTKFSETEEDPNRAKTLDRFSGQELNGGSLSPSPTEMNVDTKTSEEKINELEEELAIFDEIRNDTHNPDEMIYSRSFLMLLRKVANAIKAVDCPRSEQDLEELGLSKKGMIVNQLSIGSKIKRFEMAGGDFKPSWQQQGGGGNTQFGFNNQFGGGSRFGSSRPPNYTGRHSDNKLKPKKGPVVCRPSLDQRPLKIEKPDVLPKKSANAWKSKREERFDINAPVKDEDETKTDKIKKEVRGLLNKITPSSYQELSDEFCAYKFIENSKLLTPIIDLIFDKAVEEPHFCPLYSDLCKKQVDVERQTQQAQRDKTPDKQSEQSDKQTDKSEKPKDKAFRTEIIYKSQRTFLASDDYDNKMKELDEKLKETDDKCRITIKEEMESLRSKEKRRLLGVIKFIGQLYRHQLLIESIIDWCAVELIKRFQSTSDEVYIEYAVELVETVGKIYEKRTDSEDKMLRQSSLQKTSIQDSSAEKQAFLLEMVVTHLSQLKSSVSNRVRFAIMDLEDLKKNRWMPRGGEKGPKTINEVREEVEKEQQVNELERIEHEKQKDKIQLLRKPQGGRIGYGGRSSADRRQAAAASSLLPRDSKTESRISSARLSELDKETTAKKPAWRKDNSSSIGGGHSSTTGGGDS